MSVRGRLLTAALLAGVAVACGHPDARIVDQYFGAVRAKDTQTLQSFAAVNFDKPVESWEVKQTLEETRQPASLPELLARQKAADEALASNKKAASAYNLEHWAEVDQVKAARKDGGKVPAKLQDVAAKWDEFTENDREHKRELAEAKEAVETEKRHMARSIGSEEGLESMKGDVVTKKLLVSVTSNGQPQDYVMTLQKYEVTGAGDQKVMSRWVVQDLQPQA